MTIKFGFIGCGKVARFHAEAVRALGHSIVSVAARHGSPNIGPFAHDFSVPARFDDWKRLISETKPDALVVCLGWDKTEGEIEEIIRQGIPVLIEKPVALSSEKLRDIMENTREFHDRVMVSYNRRFYDFIPCLKDVIQTELLLSIELNCPEAVSSLVKSKGSAIVHHMLVYMTSHWLDLLAYLTGPLRMVSMKSLFNQKKGYIDSYNGLLEAGDAGVPVHFQANFDTPSNTGMTFNFSDSVYRLSPIESLTIFRGMDILAPTKEYPLKKYVPQQASVMNTDMTHKPGFLEQVRWFADTCVARKADDGRGCRLTEALAITKLCEAIGQARPVPSPL